MPPEKIAGHAVDPSNIVTRDLLSLGRLYAEQGKYEEAEPLYQEALAITENALGAAHPDTIWIRRLIAHLAQLAGRYA